MVRRALVAAAIALSTVAIGCAPVTTGAHAIQPSQAVDTSNVWIYLQTNDTEHDGVYRCYDNSSGHPQCVKAKLVRQ